MLGLTTKGGRVKLLLQITALACLAQTGVALAVQPLDFSYRITGQGKQRPILVFNDGANIYVQPNPEADADVRIVGAAAQREGAYFVIRGLPDSFAVEGKKGRSEVTYEKRASAPTISTTTVAQAPASPAIPTTPPTPPTHRPAEATPKAPAPVAAPSVASPENKETCVHEQQLQESAFVVSFKANSSELSATVTEQLAQIVPDTTSVNSITIMPDAETAKLATERGAAIKRYFVKRGMASDNITIEPARNTGIGVEVVVVSRVGAICKPTGIAVRYKSAAAVTLVGNADAKVFLEQLCAAAGMAPLKTEGVAVPLPVSLNNINHPMIDVLKEIGAKLGARADVIYRKNEITLRYNASSSQLPTK